MTRRATEPKTPLGKALRALRVDAGLSGAKAAKAASISQSALSHYEIGERAPTALTVRELCRVYHASADVRRELVAMADATQGSVDAAAVRRRGGWQMQERTAAAAESAQTITAWKPAYIDGDCQTRAYAKAMFDALDWPPENVERTVDARMERQRIMLDGQRRHIIAHSEGALLWNLGGAAVMVEQMDKLIELSRLPNVELGVVPYTVAAGVPPYHNFTIFDRASVHFGSIHRTEFVSDYRYVAEYMRYWDAFRPLIRWGDEARKVFERVRALYAAL